MRKKKDVQVRKQYVSIVQTSLLDLSSGNPRTARGDVRVTDHPDCHRSDAGIQEPQFTWRQTASAFPEGFSG